VAIKKNNYAVMDKKDTKQEAKPIKSKVFDKIASDAQKQFKVVAETNQKIADKKDANVAIDLSGI
jgi:hypothetical protein